MEAGRTLQEARRAARLSQRQVSARSGIAQSAIARIESGRVVPRVDTLSRLLNACGSSLEVRQLLGRGVDRSLIRELLRLTPDERIQYTVESSRNVAALVDEIRGGWR